MGAAGAKTRRRLICAAETLMARHGVAAVTSRDILEAAGQRNRSALQYHFGSKEGLIRAALVQQMRRVDGRRASLLAKTKSGDTAGIMRTFILPMAEDIANWEGGHNHLALLSQFVHSPDYDFEALIDETHLPGICGAMNQVWDAMPPLSREMKVLRYRTTFSASLTALLFWSRGVVRSAPEDFTEELIGAASPIMSRAPGTDSSACWRRSEPFQDAHFSHWTRPVTRVRCGTPRVRRERHY